MPSYFYHLKLELYPTPDLTTAASKPRTKAQERDLRREIYLPPNGSDIFSTNDWPKHKAVKAEHNLRKVKKEALLEGDKQTTAQKPVVGAVIDCGPARAKNSSEDDVESERITVPIARTAQLEFPSPSPAYVHSDLGTARKDWRFGRVRVESMDMVEVMNHPVRRRGESSSALATMESPNVNAALAEIGRVAKARYTALEKNTEVGWGVVHLYRDGEETLGLGGGMEMLVMEEGMEGEGGEGRGGDDCTVLCIPAVPSYLTPSDFLGFVGEKTRDCVSHIRMVMTGRMNRYLVLMKFRDGSVARRWRKEWDGRVFNSMEVSCLYFLSHLFSNIYQLSCERQMSRRFKHLQAIKVFEILSIAFFWSLSFVSKTNKRICFFNPPVAFNADQIHSQKLVKLSS